PVLIDQFPPDSHCANLSQVAPFETAGADFSVSSLSDESEESASFSSSSEDESDDDEDSFGSGSGSGSLVPRKTTSSVGLVVTSRSTSVFSTSLPFSVVTS